MKASLILCAKNGGEQLRQCLAHLDRLNGPDDLEIILVDNNSDDGISLDMMTGFSLDTKFQCQVIQSYKPGNSAGRNRAIECASGELLLFIDADCYVEPTFANEWIAIFSKRNMSFGSGRIMRYNADHSDIGCNESLIEELVPFRGFVRRGLIQGSNMAFRRDCFDSIGFFDEIFGAGTRFAGEEWEVAMRVSFAGLRGGYFPAPGVAHDHQRPEGTARERLLFYDFGAGAVYSKYIFSKNIFVITEKFLRELFWLRRDPQRQTKMFIGASAYYLAKIKSYA